MCRVSAAREDYTSVALKIKQCHKARWDPFKRNQNLDLQLRMTVLFLFTMQWLPYLDFYGRIMSPLCDYIPIRSNFPWHEGHLFWWGFFEHIKGHFPSCDSKGQCELFNKVTKLIFMSPFFIDSYGRLKKIIILWEGPTGKIRGCWTEWLLCHMGGKNHLKYGSSRSFLPTIMSQDHKFN